MGSTAKEIGRRGPVWRDGYSGWVDGGGNELKQEERDKRLAWKAKVKLRNGPGGGEGLVKKLVGAEPRVWMLDGARESFTIFVHLGPNPLSLIETWFVSLPSLSFLSSLKFYIVSSFSFYSSSSFSSSSFSIFYFSYLSLTFSHLLRISELKVSG